MVVPFWIYILAMRRKAYLKPCYCEPGSCPHDEAPLLADGPLEEQELRNATGSVSEVTTSLLVMRHRHVKRKDGKVQKVDVAAVREVWSDKHPRLARCCCRPFVSWMNQPQVNALAKFSLRHPKLASCLPPVVVAYLDTEDPAAPEHFALPDSWRINVKQAIAVFIVTLTILIMLLALGLAIWQSIYIPLLPNDCTNVTTGIPRAISRILKRWK